MTTLLPQWWDKLTDADRDLFLAHRDADVVPAEVAIRMGKSGQWIAGWRFADQPGYTFRWPGEVQAFLRQKADEPAQEDDDGE